VEPCRSGGRAGLTRPDRRLTNQLLRRSRGILVPGRAAG